MFKFNFLPNNEEDNPEDADFDEPQATHTESTEISIKNSSNRLDFLLNEAEKLVIQCDDVEIKYICSNSLINLLKVNNLLDDICIVKAEQNHSDLLPGVYEGGLKIWECTYDLLNYFGNNKTVFKDKLVLDLGCGAGILGIYSLVKEAKSWFQDYNTEVINNITLPNVINNTERFTEKCKFFSGDWLSFVELVEKTYPSTKFDYIVTSETIYNINYYHKLHHVFEKLLNKNGIIFLAAKSFYFGVGGGIHLFEKFLDSKKTFKHKICWQSTEGVKRGIIQVEFL